MATQLKLMDPGPITYTLGSTLSTGNETAQNGSSAPQPGTNQTTDSHFPN